MGEGGVVLRADDRAAQPSYSAGMRLTGDGGRLPAWPAAVPWRAVSSWRALAASRQADLAIAAILLLWGLPDVPWWWEQPGHAGWPARSPARWR